MTSTQVFLTQGAVGSAIRTNLVDPSQAQLDETLDLIIGTFEKTRWSGAIFPGDEHEQAYRANLGQMRRDFRALYTHAKRLDAEPGAYLSPLGGTLQSMLDKYAMIHTTTTADGSVPFLGVRIAPTVWNRAKYRITVLTLLSHCDPLNYVYVTTSPIR